MILVNFNMYPNVLFLIFVNNMNNKKFIYAYIRKLLLILYSNIILMTLSLGCLSAN